MTRTRVLLADDHTIVAEGLASLLEPEYELVGRVQNGRDLLRAADELSPDVIVTDISMPLLNGIEALRQLKKTKPNVRVVFLTVHADISYVAEAFRAGASGYVLKQSAAEELRSAIRAVHEGRTYVTPLIARDRLDDLLEADHRFASMSSKTSRSGRCSANFNPRMAVSSPAASTTKPPRVTRRLRRQPFADPYLLSARSACSG